MTTAHRQCQHLSRAAHFDPSTSQSLCWLMKISPVFYTMWLMKKVRNRTGKCSAFLRKKNQKKIPGVTWVQELFTLWTLSQQLFLASSKERDAGWIFIPVVPVAQIQNQMEALDKKPGFVSVWGSRAQEGGSHLDEENTVNCQTLGSWNQRKGDGPEPFIL